jgi:hypothetical protein
MKEPINEKSASAPITNSERKKEDLNFKRWLLSLISIGNFILGALLVIMGAS